MSRKLYEMRDISFAYEDMIGVLLKDVNFSIQEGEKIGLLGYNGSGKSTLYKLIAGELEPIDGETVSNVGEIFYFRQEDCASGDMSVRRYLLESWDYAFSLYEKMKELESNLEDNAVKYSEVVNKFNQIGGYRFLQNIEEVVFKFGFKEDDLDRNVETLSGGEKRLLKIVSGFLRDYDIILMDEPTNYLDTEGIEYLIEAIKSSNNSFLIVSHNRWFLDRTVKKIFEISRGTLKEYSGNYSIFKETKERIRKEKLREANKIKAEIKKLHQTRHNYQIWANRKEKQKIGAGDKGYISARAAKLMKKSVQAEDRIKNKIEEMKKTKPYVEKFYDFKFEKVDIPKGACLTVNRLRETAGERVLFDNLSFNIRWGERILIDGPNGSGKTTLINKLLNNEDNDSGQVIWDGQARIGYLPQQWNRENDRLKPIDIFNEDERQRAMTLAGCLKVPGENFRKKFEELSEGQKRKIKLVQLIIEEPNVLILDEPTTHLDYITVEKLEEALKGYCGTLIMATHDRWLRDRITDRNILLT